MGTQWQTRVLKKIAMCAAAFFRTKSWPWQEQADAIAANTCVLCVLRCTPGLSMTVTVASMGVAITAQRPVSIHMLYTASLFAKLSLSDAV